MIIAAVECGHLDVPSDRDNAVEKQILVQRYQGDGSLDILKARVLLEDILAEHWTRCHAEGSRNFESSTCA